MERPKTPAQRAETIVRTAQATKNPAIIGSEVRALGEIADMAEKAVPFFKEADPAYSRTLQNVAESRRETAAILETTEL